MGLFFAHRILPAKQWTQIGGSQLPPYEASDWTTRRTDLVELGPRPEWCRHLDRGRLSIQHSTMPLLSRLPAPLVADILDNRCLPIVGAGFSRNAVVPGGRLMPLWPDLGRELGRQVTDYPTDESRPLEAISAYEQEFGRARLIEELHRLLYLDTARPGPAHLEFCRLPFDLVCTTNFDFLLEQGYVNAPRAYTPIVEEAQLSLRVNPRAVTLLKLHGDTSHPDRMVLTEEDYDRFIAVNPLIVTYLSNLLITRTALFVGFSLDDPDLRQVMTLVSDRLGRLRRQAYALTYKGSPYERRRYERRNVRCVDLA